jgi:arginyl-tRNA synthetase
MNLFSILKEKIVEGLKKFTELKDTTDFSKVVVEPCKDKAHGEAATNAALVLAKEAGSNPRQFAEKIKDFLEKDQDIEKIDIAGPGFVNIKLRSSFWQSILTQILKEKEHFGKTNQGGGRKINVESLSTNPTGPIHMGHCRIAVIGDVLSNLLAFVGYDVTREYYINDAGGQIDILARSVYIRYKQSLGIVIEAIPEGLYPGDYLIPVGKALAEKEGKKWLDQPEEAWLPIFRPFAVDAMMALIREDLKTIGINYDVFTSEHEVIQKGYLDKALNVLEKQNLIYTGVLEAPKGMVIEDFEQKPQTLFKSTTFGDDVDRPLKRSNGTWAYFAGDIGYHLYKYERGFNHMVLVLGGDHGGYTKRIKAAVNALSHNQVNLDAKMAQMVKVLRGGEIVRMSKRAGQFVTMREVVEEVTKDVVRFIMLTRRDEAPLEFDLTEVVEQSKENPVFYVQYAYTRGCSVLRNATEALNFNTLPDLTTVDLSLLNDESELYLIQTLALWPRSVETAANMHEPHRIAFYLQDVAHAFHSLWNKGRDQKTLRFLREDNRELSLARLAMIQAMLFVMKSGLNIIGVTPHEEM